MGINISLSPQIEDQFQENSSLEKNNKTNNTSLKYSYDLSNSQVKKILVNESDDEATRNDSNSEIFSKRIVLNSKIKNFKLINKTDSSNLTTNFKTSVRIEIDEKAQFVYLSSSINNWKSCEMKVKENTSIHYIDMV